LKRFRDSLLQGKFTISAELMLNRESNAAEVREQCQRLTGLVDAMLVTDNSWPWVQMSPLAASALVMQEGLDALPVLTCRDRNRVALISDLLGLQALGVTSAMLVRGYRMPKEHQVPARSVFELRGRELLAIAEQMSQSAAAGSGSASAAGLLTGTNARVFKPQPGWKADSLLEKAHAGARFMHTQLCMNLDTLQDYLSHLIEARVTWQFSIIVTLAVLPSAEMALWLKSNLRDSLVPDPLIQRLQNAPDPEQEGIRICAELMRKIAELPGVSGVHIFTPGKPGLIARAIEQSGMRNQDEISPAGEIV
jgi:methylenetetrahydrofolate reductase (NADPH)